MSLKLTTIVCSICLSAAALAHPRLYLGLMGGVDMSDNINSLNNNTTQYEKKYEPGAASMVSLGLAFNPSFAMGFEGGYLRSNISRLSGPNLSDVGNLQGNTVLEPIMLNAYYTMKSVINSGLEPYLGLGVGGVYVRNNWSANLENNSTAVHWSSNYHYFTVGYQVILGFNYWLNQHASIGLVYHYLGINYAHEYVAGLAKDTKAIYNQNILGFTLTFRT